METAVENKITVSVLIPVYKAEKFLPRCLDSVLKQTYADLDIVLIDDGSPDGSGNICDDYAQKDKRIRVIHQENRGVSKTRNALLSYALGEYILFVDADDYIEPEMIADLAKKANQCDSDITMCAYFVETEGVCKEKALDFRTRYSSQKEIKENLLIRFYTQNNAGLKPLWNKLIRRDLYEKNDIRFQTQLKRAEDMWFVFECLKCAQSLSYLPKPYYHYVQTPGSVMQTVYLDQFQQWKYTRTRLLKENESLQFDLDFPLFFSSFLMNSTVHAKNLLLMHHKDLAFDVLSDALLHKAAQYINQTSLPIHIKMVMRLVKHRQVRFALLLLKAWNLFSR